MAAEDLAEYAAHQGIAKYPTDPPTPDPDATPTVIDDEETS